MFDVYQFSKRYDVGQELLQPIIDFEQNSITVDVGDNVNVNLNWRDDDTTAVNPVAAITKLDGSGSVGSISDLTQTTGTAIWSLTNAQLGDSGQVRVQITDGDQQIDITTLTVHVNPIDPPPDEDPVVEFDEPSLILLAHPPTSSQSIQGSWSDAETTAINPLPPSPTLSFTIDAVPIPSGDLNETFSDRTQTSGGWSMSTDTAFRMIHEGQDLVVRITDGDGNISKITPESTVQLTWGLNDPLYDDANHPASSVWLADQTNWEIVGPALTWVADGSTWADLSNDFEAGVELGASAISMNLDAASTAAEGDWRGRFRIFIPDGATVTFEVFVNDLQVDIFGVDGPLEPQYGQPVTPSQTYTVQTELIEREAGDTVEIRLSSTDGTGGLKSVWAGSDMTGTAVPKSVITAPNDAVSNIEGTITFDLAEIVTIQGGEDTSADIVYSIVGQTGSNGESNATINGSVLTFTATDNVNPELVVTYQAVSPSAGDFGTITFTVVEGFVVDVENGTDDALGTWASPERTMARILERGAGVLNGKKIWVRPGLYDHHRLYEFPDKPNTTEGPAMRMYELTDVVVRGMTVRADGQPDPLFPKPEVRGRNANYTGTITTNSGAQYLQANFQYTSLDIRTSGTAFGGVVEIQNSLRCGFENIKITHARLCGFVIRGRDGTIPMRCEGCWGEDIEVFGAGLHGALVHGRDASNRAAEPELPLNNRLTRVVVHSVCNLIDGGPKFEQGIGWPEWSEIPGSPNHVNQPVVNAGGEAITTAKGTYGTTIEYCEVYDHGKEGIVTSAAIDCTVRYNYVHDHRDNPSYNFTNRGTDYYIDSDHNIEDLFKEDPNQNPVYTGPHQDRAIYNYQFYGNVSGVPVLGGNHAPTGLQIACEQGGDLELIEAYNNYLCGAVVVLQFSAHNGSGELVNGRKVNGIHKDIHIHHNTLLKNTGVVVRFSQNFGSVYSGASVASQGLEVFQNFQCDNNMFVRTGNSSGQMIFDQSVDSSTELTDTQHFVWDNNGMANGANGNLAFSPAMTNGQDGKILGVFQWTVISPQFPPHENAGSVQMSHVPAINNAANDAADSGLSTVAEDLLGNTRGTPAELGAFERT